MPKVLKAEDFVDGGGKANDTPHNTDVDPDKVVGGGPGDNAQDDLTKDKDDGKPPKGADNKKGAKDGNDNPPKLKYADQIQAENAVKEAEKRMHKATEEAAMLRKMLLEKNNQSNTPQQSEEEKIAESAILEIRKLDAENDPDYDIKCARIWAKANRQIAKLEASQQVTEKERETSNNRSLEEKIDSSLTGAGFKSAWDKKAFYVLANYVPKEITDQDEQIEWVIGQIADYRKTVLAEFSEKEKEEEEARVDLRVLGRGSHSRTQNKGNDTYQPKTLGDQVKELRQSRKLK